ncbi:MAG TPA: HAMP domain-containing protein, partial [Burkholderiaceae bacterium]|nr:HAMP domain-containing protein [Burkholderiaceae bacterium]
MRLALPTLRTGPRLFLSFLLVLAVMGLIVWLAIGRLHALNAMAENLVHDKLAKQQRAADWLGAVSLNGTRAMAIARSDSLELEDYFRGHLQAGDRLIDELSASFHGDSAAEQALLTAIEQQQVAYQKLLTRIFEFKSVGKIQDVEHLAGIELEPAFERYAGAIRALLEHEKQQAAVLAVKSAQAYRASRMTLMGLGGLTLGLGILFAWLLTRGIVRPLKYAVAVAQKIAQGQLGTEIRNERHDELGQLLNALQTMNTSLAVTIRNIDHEASVITAAAGKMV